MAKNTPPTREAAGRKGVNITLDEQLFWDGRALAAKLRLPNISTLVERLLAKELKEPTLTTKRKAA